MAGAPLKNFLDLYKSMPVQDSNERKRYRKKFEKVDTNPLDIEKAKFKLEKNLNFFQVLPTPKEMAADRKEATSLSRRVVQLLRHSLPDSGLSFAKDGSVLLSQVLQMWKDQGFHTTEEKVIAASHPSYGNNKIRFLVGEKLGGERFVMAVGGHSFDLPHPFGSIPLDLHTASQVDPAFHRTNARYEIEKDGFISQMQRGGGINMSYGQNHPYLQSGHGFRVFVAKAIKNGIFFCHNRYSDILFCLGKNDSEGFDGKLPLRVGQDQLAVYQ